MDFSNFCDEDFDVKAWVNSAFQTPADSRESKDGYAATLVMKLQLFIQEVSNSLEETGQNVVQNLPRVVSDVAGLRQEAAFLQDMMKHVKKDIKKIEQDTGQSMQNLVEIDKIKTRMENASAALQEADNWTTLSEDVDEAFSSEDLELVGEKLKGMQQSLKLLVNVPDYEERCTLLRDLKSRYEGLISSQILAAISSRSLDSTLAYVRILKDLESEGVVGKYYHQVHKKELLNEWSKVCESVSLNVSDENREQLLAKQLSKYYDVIVTHFIDQVKWSTGILRQPTDALASIAAETLRSIEPTVTTKLSSLLDGNPDVLTLLLELKQVADRFAKNLENCITAKNEKEQYKLNSEPVYALAQAVYAVYRPYIGRYGALEKDLLLTKYDSDKQDYEDISEGVRQFTASVTPVFAHAREAQERCIQISNGCGFVQLISALQAYFNCLIQDFRQLITKVRDVHKVDDTLTATDWSTFLHSLNIIQTCGEVLQNTDRLENDIMTGIISVVGRYQQDAQGSPVRKSPLQRPEIKNPFQMYDELLLEHWKDRDELQKLYTKVQKTDTSGVLDKVREELNRVCQECHRLSFDIVFSHIQEHLNQVPELPSWNMKTLTSASEMPSFSFAPQEYITKIGQYLLTLPQHLDAFTTQDDPGLRMALNHGKLPYTDDQALSTIEHIAQLWLVSVARATMHMYADNILKIATVSECGVKQLINDIDYLCNVLDDLGIPATDKLQCILALLKATPENFEATAENMPQRIIYGVSNMRRIKI